MAIDIDDFFNIDVGWLIMGDPYTKHQLNKNNADFIVVQSESMSS